MKLIFAGTPQFAVPSLERLVQEGHDVSLVVTQPDRPAGRGQELAASPVKQFAERLGLPIAQPAKIRSNEEFRKQIEEIRPDAIIVVGYGRIIPTWMLELPRYGNINVHGSLLPKYRGAAPIQWAIANGETVTGVTTMQLDEGLDTGPMLMKAEMPIAPEDTAVTIAPRLAAVGAIILIETLRGLEAGTLRGEPQNEAEATLAPILTKQDGHIDFSRRASEIHNRLRGFQPWPGAFTSFRGSGLRILAAKPVSETTSEAGGTLIVRGNDLLLACGRGSLLEVAELQPENKKRMAARDFINGYKPQPHERLGS